MNGKMGPNHVPHKDRPSPNKANPNTRDSTVAAAQASLQDSSIDHRIGTSGQARAVSPKKRLGAVERTDCAPDEIVLDHDMSLSTGTLSPSPSKKPRLLKSAKRRFSASEPSDFPGSLADAINGSVQPSRTEHRAVASRKSRPHSVRPSHGPESSFESNLAHTLGEPMTTNQKQAERLTSTSKADTLAAPADPLRPPLSTGASYSLETPELMYRPSPEEKVNSTDFRVLGIPPTNSSNEEALIVLQMAEFSAPSALDEASASQPEWLASDMNEPTSLLGQIYGIRGTPDAPGPPQAPFLVAADRDPHRIPLNSQGMMDGNSSIHLGPEPATSPAIIPPPCSQPSVDDVEVGSILEGASAADPSLPITYNQTCHLSQKYSLDVSGNQNARVRSAKVPEEPDVANISQSMPQKFNATHASPSRDSLFSATPSPSPPRSSQRSYPTSLLSLDKPPRLRLDYVEVPPPLSPHRMGNTLSTSRPGTKQTKGQPFLTGGSPDGVLVARARQSTNLGVQTVKRGPPHKKQRMSTSDEPQGKHQTHKRKHSGSVKYSIISDRGAQDKPIVISDNSTEEVEIVERPYFPAPYYDNDKSEPVFIPDDFIKSPAWLGPVHCFLRSFSKVFPQLYAQNSVAFRRNMANDEHYFERQASLTPYGSYVPDEEGEYSIWSLRVDENFGGGIEVEDTDSDDDVPLIQSFLDNEVKSHEIAKQVQTPVPSNSVRKRGRPRKATTSKRASTGLQDHVDGESSPLRPRKRQRSTEVVPESDIEDDMVVSPVHTKSAKARGKQKAIEPPLSQKSHSHTRPSGEDLFSSTPPVSNISSSVTVIPVDALKRAVSYTKWLEKGLVPKNYPQTVDDLARLGQAIEQTVDEVCNLLIKSGVILFQGFGKEDILIKTHDQSETPLATPPVEGDDDFDLQPPIYTVNSLDHMASQDPSAAEPPAPPSPEVPKPMSNRIAPVSVDPSLLGGQQEGQQEASTSGKKATFWNRSKRKSALQAPRYNDDDDISEEDEGDYEEPMLSQKKQAPKKKQTKVPTEVEESAPRPKRVIIAPRRNWPKDPSGPSFCHHCRTTTTRFHMICSAVCGKAFCQRCIETKYTGLKFDSEAENWLCLLCLDRCGCDQCTRKRGLEYTPGTITHLEEEPEEEEEVPPFPPLPHPPAELSLDKMVYFGTMYGMHGELLGRGFSANGNKKNVTIFAECETPADQPPAWRIRSASPPTESEDEGAGPAAVGLSQPHTDELPRVDLQLLTGEDLYVGNVRILQNLKKRMNPVPAPLTIDTDPGTPIDDEMPLTPLPDDVESCDIGSLLEGETRANSVDVTIEHDRASPLNINDIKSAIDELKSKPGMVEDNS